MPDNNIRRNDSCPCGSGRRYKDCHGALRPAGSESLSEIARAGFAQGRLEEAARDARAAIERDSTDAEAWTVLGLALEAAQPDAALDAWLRAVALAPRQPEAHFRIGDFRRRRGEHDVAIAAYEAAIEAGSTHPVLLNNLGLSLQAQGRFDAAADRYREAIALQPDLLPAHANLGDVLSTRHRYAEAAASYARAAALNPNLAALWNNLGFCQRRAGAPTAARTSFQRALSFAPDDPQALLGLASLDIADQRYEEAAPLIERALALQPESAEATNLLLYTRQHTCDWADFERLLEAQRASLAQPEAPSVTPHNLLALPYAPDELLTAARKWAKEHLGGINPGHPLPPSAVDGRVRIAYIGPDFRTHPLANLLTEVIERHDRTRFEVFAYSFGPDDGSPARARFVAAFDRFIDVRGESFEATARRIADDRVAVLFDTSGYVIHARSEIFALRPAPIQVNCIGFPGTLGADCYDYVLTDRFVTPPEQQANFVERFLYLPDCYLPGDSRRPIGAIPSRAQCGLPEDAFVFCCFNASYKILPQVFEAWMRLLRAVPASVLWLLQTNAPATGNLRREAKRWGVAPERLIFAPRIPLAEHLARHAAADLFLDTTPCNAHTTANDALFVGLPIVTCAGETFASRVSGSQLNATELPELVTYDLESYEALALKLARDPDTLRSLRARLRANSESCPLFDTGRYTRELEKLICELCRPC
ncbi:MAG: tetratricopeptide repeat protein [Betaproteobacteria bacterium]|nr:MAG: tetratricopeptide repeat protein [Betaproteobacteria bacterium]